MLTVIGKMLLCLNTAFDEHFYYAEAFVHSVHTCFLLSSAVPAVAAERRAHQPLFCGLVQSNCSFLLAGWLPDSTRGRADFPNTMLCWGWNQSCQ